MDITIGPETISLFYDKQLIHDASDLYRLQFEDLVNLERWGETSARNLINSIDQSRNVPYERVLFALGIRFVGETVARKLAHAFPYIDQLIHDTKEQLLEVDEIGERIAGSVVDFSGEKRFPLFSAFGKRGCSSRLRKKHCRLAQTNWRGSPSLSAVHSITTRG